MKYEEEQNIYLKVDSMDLTPFEKYKYLTGNDPDIIALRQKVKNIAEERNLSSVMNDTKWLKLQEGIQTLPFPPAYNDKQVHRKEPAFRFNDFETEPGYLGDWSSFWEEGFPIFFTIEWLEIRPKYREVQGRLVPDKVTDETNELIQLLEGLHIPFEQDNGTITIYGYV